MSKGTIKKVAGPLVIASGMRDANMFDVVRVSDERLIGEIIEIHGDEASIQVYEETSGLGPGEPVESMDVPLSVELGPGLLTSIYDGIQRPLDDIMKETGSNNLKRGVEVPSLKRDKKWQFVPTVKAGDTVTLTVKTENLPAEGWNAIQMSVDYDDALVPAGTYEIGAGLKDGKAEANNNAIAQVTFKNAANEDVKPIQIGLISVAAQTANGDLLTIPFTVAEDVEAGAELSFTANVSTFVRANIEGTTWKEPTTVATVEEKTAKVTVEKAASITWGDANGDGSVDSMDALAVLQHEAGLQLLEGDNLTAADVDGVTGVDSMDALAILQREAGIIDHFVVEVA